jgi:hypothetical protein
VVATQRVGGEQELHRMMIRGSERSGVADLTVNAQGYTSDPPGRFDGQRANGIVGSCHGWVIVRVPRGPCIAARTGGVPRTGGHH